MFLTEPPNSLLALHWRYTQPFMKLCDFSCCGKIDLGIPGLYKWGNTVEWEARMIFLFLLIMAID